MQRQVSKNVAVTAMFVALALILSYVEALSGINNFLPIAGTKLGFANIAVTVIAYMLPFWCAVVVSVTRVALSSLLFGSVTSLVFSLGGALFALVFILFAKKVLLSRVSLVGTSAGSAAFHMIGQLLAASWVLQSFSIFHLLPLYLLISAFTGMIIGVISQVLYTNLKKIKVR